MQSVPALNQRNLKSIRKSKTKNKKACGEIRSLYAEKVRMRAMSAPTIHNKGEIKK